MVMCTVIGLGTTGVLHFRGVDDLADGRRDGNPHGLEYLAAVPKTLGADLELFPLVFECDFLKCFEILLDVRPLNAAVAGSFEPPVEFLPQNESKEAAKNMAPDCLIPLMEYGPCIQDGLHVFERVLYHPKLFVFERHVLGRQAGVAPEDPYAIVFGFFFDLFHVDGYAPSLHFHEPAVTLVADHGFRPTFNLLIERFDYGFPVRGIFSRLPGIEAYDITPALNHYLLYLQGRRVFGGVAFRINLNVIAWIYEDFLANLF